MELIHNHSKIVWVKVDTNLISFLYIIKEQLEFEIRNTISSIFLSTQMKSLVLNLAKYVQDLYEKNKILMIDIKENLIKWRDILCTWLKIIKTAKISVLPKLICKFNTVQIKMSACYFVPIDKLILNFKWKDKKKNSTIKIILRKNKSRELKLLDFNIYCKYTVIETV